ncbi:MAG TPA: hypothetical protein VF168_11585 [Trueperaceae bacterium]
MPNEVFLRTRAGLSTMVSSRAADRILEGALKGSGHNPDDVNQSQMRSALLGPVLHELETVLPRDGLKRNLERLAKSLKDEVETARALLTGSIPADLSLDAVPSAHTEDLAGRPAGPEAHAAEPQAAGPEAQAAEPQAGGSEAYAAEPQANEEPLTARVPEGPFEAYAGPPAATKASAAQRERITPRLLRRLADDELDGALTRFALIDNVRLVAAVRADGSVPASRGEGLDLELLSRLSRLSLALLAKGGELRSIHLGHSLGQLLLFPIGPDLLIVYGGSELNLGSVMTAFTALALEEEL